MTNVMSTLRIHTRQLYLVRDLYSHYEYYFFKRCNMQPAEMRSFSVMRHLQVCVLAIFAVLGLTFSEEHI